MSESNSKGRRAKSGEPSGPRPIEDLARELSGSGTSPAKSGEGESLREIGTFRLDKSGALLGRAKLEPRKAHRSATDEATPEAAAAEPKGPRKAALPPKRGSLRPAGYPKKGAHAGSGLVRAAAGEDAEIEIPAGSFLYGEAKQATELTAYSIDRSPVTHAQYAHFVRATGHRPPLYWKGGSYAAALSDHPVVGVDYYDALAYAQWAGKDLPFEDEWERAARSTDGRTYPWGNDQEFSGANTARVGLKMTVPVDLHKANVSPDGVRDLVGNAWEFTHSPAPGGGVVVRGGSWHDFALYAKTWFRFASKPEARNGTIGFRCVRRPEEAKREDAPREVSPEKCEAEIAARRGPQAETEHGEWSAEKRDLVLDAPRLASYVAEARAQALLGTTTASVPIARDVVAEPPPATPEPGTPKAGTPKSGTPKAKPEPRVHVEAKAKTKPVKATMPPKRAPKPEVRPTPASEQMAVERAADEVVVSEAAAREARQERAGAGPRMPLTMWVLLGIGFLLVGGMLVLLVNRDDEGAGDESAETAFEPDPTPAPRSPLADLPEALVYEEFPGANEPPRVLDAAYASDRKRLGQGSWLLLIIDPRTEEGEQTLETAHALHRRLEPLGVHVTVVLPRGPYQDAEGHLVGDQALDAQLRADGRHWLWDGIHVVLDPATSAEDGRGVLATKYAFEGDRVAAMLLHEGQIESRTAPPEGGFTEVSLVSLAKRAMEMAR